MGHVFLGLLVTRLTGLHAFRLMYFKRALSLASSEQALFILSQPRPHNRVRGFVQHQNLIIGNLTAPVTVDVQIVVPRN